MGQQAWLLRLFERKFVVIRGMIRKGIVNGHAELAVGGLDGDHKENRGPGQRFRHGLRSARRSVATIAVRIGAPGRN